MPLFEILSPMLFPFATAIPHMTTQKFSIGAVLRREDILKEAVENILLSLKGDTPVIGYYEISDRSYPKSEILYIVSVILIAASKNIILAKKFALGESRRAEKLFKVDENSLLKIMKAKKVNEEEYLIPISEYIKRSPDINQKEWKLVNRTVKNGAVKLEKKQLIRVMRPDITNHVVNTIKNTKVEEETIRMLSRHIQKLEESIPKQAPIQIGKNGQPPCVAHGICELSSGENLNHPGRFLVAAWLVSAGYDIDEITNLFVNAPDYNEGITRYQVENVKNTGYKPQNCEKLKSLGLCHRTEKCGNITNPLQY